MPCAYTHTHGSLHSEDATTNSCGVETTTKSSSSCMSQSWCASAYDRYSGTDRWQLQRSKLVNTLWQEFAYLFCIRLIRDCMWYYCPTSTIMHSLGFLPASQKRKCDKPSGKSASMRFRAWEWVGGMVCNIRIVPMLQINQYAAEVMAKTAERARVCCQPCPWPRIGAKERRCWALQGSRVSLKAIEIKAVTAL